MHIARSSLSLLVSSLLMLEFCSQASLANSFEAPSLTDLLLDESVEIDVLPSKIRSYFVSKEAQDKHLREDKGLNLIFIQTQLSAETLKQQCVEIEDLLQESLPKSIRSFSIFTIDEKVKKNEPYRSRDLAIRGKFLFNGKSFSEFILIPGEKSSSQAKKIAGEILEKFKKQSVEKQYLSSRERIEGNVHMIAQSVRKLLPPSIEVIDAPSGEVADPSGKEFYLAVNFPPKMKMKEIEEQCRLISTVKAKLPPTIKMIATVRHESGFPWWTLEGNVKGGRFIGTHFLQEPYLTQVMKAMKQLETTRNGSSEVVTTLNIGDSGKNSVSRSQLLINELAAWRPEDTVTLYSLKPEQLKNSSAGFHGWKVLGSKKLNTDSARQVTTSISSAVEKQKLLAGSCFIPRHGVSISHGGQTTDFIVCFHCREVVAISGERIEFFHINRQPKTALNAILSERNISLAPDQGGEEMVLTNPDEELPGLAPTIQVLNGE